MSRGARETSKLARTDMADATAQLVSAVRFRPSRVLLFEPLDSLIDESRTCLWQLRFPKQTGLAIPLLRTAPTQSDNETNATKHNASPDQRLDHNMFKACSMRSLWLESA
jgi:hypothetical protein